MPKKKQRTITKWEGLPEDFDPKDWYGFLYLIEQLSTGKKYVGKKAFWHKRTLPKTKKRRKRSKKIVESDWRSYQSSSDEVKSAIKQDGIDGFRFSILGLYRSRCELNYSEVREQFIRDVLTENYFNGNILGRYFRGRV